MLACVGQFRNQPRPSALSNLGGQLAHGFLGDRAAFTARQGGAGFIESGAKLDTPPLALFP